MIIGLNPSTADAQKNDPTIRRCIDYAARWGMGGLLMGNLFAWRSRFPTSLAKAADPVGPENDEWLIRMRDASQMVLGAWGIAGDFDIKRTAAVLEMFPDLHHLGLTGNGHPRHPLYLKKTLRPEPMDATQRVLTL